MNEQALFLAAIEIADPGERKVYLDRACEGHPRLRNRIEALLVEHERSGEFLNVPVLKQLAGDAESARSVESPSHAGTDKVKLSFLQPSTVPGSLGRLRHYEIQEVIGRGGCGIVLKGFDQRLQRVVAIKVLSPELAATSPARKRFLREARATAAVRHENVVSIHAVEEQPLPFLVMEFIDGETLQHRLDQTGPLSMTEALEIGRQVADGLAAAHAKGLIHRDIKPANLLLERGSGSVKITDFGLARTADDASLTRSGVIAGTPLYMSPEQAQGMAIDQRSDLFSLGSVLYVMCSGRPPFRASTMLAVLKRVAEQQPRPIRQIIPEIPAWLEEIIARLHAKQPDNRYQTAAQVSEILSRRQREPAGFGVLESAASDAAPARGPQRQPRSILAALAFVLLTAIVVTEGTGVSRIFGSLTGWFSSNSVSPQIEHQFPAQPSLDQEMAASDGKGPTLEQAAIAVALPPVERETSEYFTAPSLWGGIRTYRRGAYAGSTVSYELHVQKIDGTQFTGIVFDNGPGRNRAEVEGEINGGNLTWRERARGNVVSIQATLDGEVMRVDFAGRYANGARNIGDGLLRRISPVLPSRPEIEGAILAGNAERIWEVSFLNVTGNPETVRRFRCQPGGTVHAIGPDRRPIGSFTEQGDQAEIVIDAAPIDHGTYRVVRTSGGPPVWTGTFTSTAGEVRQVRLATFGD